MSIYLIYLFYKEEIKSKNITSLEKFVSMIVFSILSLTTIAYWILLYYWIRYYKALLGLWLTYKKQ